VWDAVLPRLNDFARIPVCGLAANLNKTELPEGPDRTPELMRAILSRSLLLRGFLHREFVDTMFADFLTDMTGWVAAGKVKYKEDITEGLEQAPEAFVGMLRGANFGKTIIQVS
jgi:NADPH-dependent curcumin reductase